MTLRNTKRSTVPGPSTLAKVTAATFVFNASIIPTVDNAFDIGSSGFRIRDIYVGGNIFGGFTDEAVLFGGSSGEILESPGNIDYDYTAKTLMLTNNFNGIHRAFQCFNNSVGSSALVTFELGQDFATGKIFQFTYFNQGFTPASIFLPNMARLNAGPGATNGMLISTSSTGAIKFSCNSSVVQGQVTTSGLELPLNTAGRVYISGTNGLVTTDADLTYNTGTDTLGLKRSNHSEGEFKAITETSSTTVNVTAANRHVICTASATVTVNLPDRASNRGLILTIKKTNASANPVNVTRAGSDTIDGATVVALSTQYESVTIIAGDTEWWKV